MSNEWKEWSVHVLAELKRFDDNHKRIYDKLEEQGQTLVRNTITLEEHVRRTNLLETEVSKVKEEVDGLHIHLGKVDTILSIFKPTKAKIKMLVLISSLLASLYGGREIATNANTRLEVMETIEKILQ